MSSRQQNRRTNFNREPVFTLPLGELLMDAPQATDQHCAAILHLWISLATTPTPSNLALFNPPRPYRLF
ncbi:MAG: hypothetical protein ABW104_10565 [Candidatus Thiodiazotropha sp. 6PLUC2]